MTTALSRTEFARRAAAYLDETLLPGSFVLDERSFSVAVKNADLELFVRLDTYYELARAAPREASDQPPARALALLARNCQPPVLSGETLAEVIPSLMPRVKARAYFERLRAGATMGLPASASGHPAGLYAVDAGAVPYEPLGDHLGLALAIDRPDRVETVLYPEKLGASFESLLAIALANAKQKLAGELTQLAPGLFAAGDDDYAAERILFPERLAELGLEGDPVVILATANTLFVTGSDDTIGIGTAFKLAMAATEHAKAVALFPLVYRDGAWSLFTRPGSRFTKSLSVPLLAEISSLYALQDAALARALEERGDPRILATLEAYTAPDLSVPSTITTWTSGERVLLPYAGYMRLVEADGATSKTRILEFDELLALAGDALKRVPELYPPRYAAEVFP